MKTTVGPLPAAVYWRRRAVVLGVMLVVVIMLWTACSPSSANKRSSAANTSSLAPSSSSSVASSPASLPTLTLPTTGSVPSSTPAGGPPPDTGQPTATGSNQAPACADTDLTLTTVPEMATAQAGVYIKFTLNIKNISGRPCTRDLGPDHQELYLQSGTDKVWSSDVCNAAHGSEPVLMMPNIVHTYNNTWNGLASNNGCSNRVAPKPAKYQLIGRLDTKLSEPVTLQLT